MKVYLLFSYIFYLLLAVAALPLSRRPTRQPDPDEPSYRPTPGDNDKVPLPGENGVFYHEPNNIAYAYYGNSKMKGHAKHVSIHQQMFPQNSEPMKLAGASLKKMNRDEALDKIPTRGKENLVRDEKPPAMLASENHATTTTVQFLPKKESNREGGMLSRLSALMIKHRAKGRVVDNSEWLFLNRNQRIAHEAPARLSTSPEHTLRDGSSVPKPDPNARPKKPKGKGKDKAAASVLPDQQKGKGENEAKASGKEAEIVPGTNLISNHIIPVGHAWRPEPQSSATRASHFGAPLPHTDAENRHPLRVMNRDHAVRIHAQKTQEREDAKKAGGTKTVPYWKKPEDTTSPAWKKFVNTFGKEGIVHFKHPPAEVHDIPLHNAKDSKRPIPVDNSRSPSRLPQTPVQAGPSKKAKSPHNVPYPPPLIAEGQGPPQAGPSHLNVQSHVQAPSPVNDGHISQPPSRGQSPTPPQAGPSHEKGKGRARSPIGTKQNSKLVGDHDGHISQPPSRGRSPTPPQAAPSHEKGKGHARSPVRSKQDSKLSTGLPAGQRPSDAGASNPEGKSRGRSPNPVDKSRGPKVPPREQSPSPPRGRPSRSKAQTRRRPDANVKQESKPPASTSRRRNQSPPQAESSRPKRNTRSRKPPSPDKRIIPSTSPSRERSPSPPKAGPSQPKRAPKKQENAVASGSNTNRPRTRASAKNEAANKAPSPPSRSRSPNSKPKPGGRPWKP